MLVLGRRVDESIVIGEDIKITVVSVEKGVVKLGIEAPKEVAILREELVEQVKDSNKAASKSDIDILAKLSEFLRK
ncbi:MAG: carbon storage regulator CsrA [Sulfurimonas sp.]|jgi:carbon storage regulator CsrA|nr:carbon storage regulator CsrA [Sulfurimonadaceae bacterium]